MHRILFTALAVVAILFAGSSTALATKPTDDGQHKVWVCKYVGAPGDFETLKPGKQPISVDVAAADAYVGADFADGQTHSFVIDLQTEGNTGQGNSYIGDAQCPSTPTETPSPTPSLTASPSDEPSPSVTPSLTPSEPPPSESPSEQPSATPTPSPSETPSTSSSPTLKPSSKPTPERPVTTQPPTDTEPASTGVADDHNLMTILTILAGLGTLAYVLIWGFKRPYHR